MFWVVNFVKHVGSTPGDVVLLAFRCFSGGATPQNIFFLLFSGMQWFAPRKNS